MTKVITILIDINIDLAEPLLPLRKYRNLFQDYARTVLNFQWHLYEKTRGFACLKNDSKILISCFLKLLGLLKFELLRLLRILKNFKNY